MCTKHGGQGLGSIEEFGGRDSVVVLGIDRNIDEGTPEGREQRSSLGHGWGRHGRGGSKEQKREIGGCLFVCGREKMENKRRWGEEQEEEEAGGDRSKAEGRSVDVNGTRGCLVYL